MFSGLIPVAQELRDTNAKDSESRLDLATQLVKQAYSECPNLDLLIGAILSNPLYRCVRKSECSEEKPVLPILVDQCI